MDPFVEIEIGDEKKRTNAHKNGGKNPCWDEQLIFRIRDQTHMMLRVWDEESMCKNDLVGEAKIWLEEICKETEER